jgi:hypothetical protein
VVTSPPGLVDRLGLALVAPRRAFAVVDGAEGRAGLSDASTLLILKFVALELRVIVAALWTMLQVGFAAGLGSLGPRVIGAVGLDLGLLFAGGLFVTVAAGRKRKPSRDFDLAASAWIPYLGFSLAVSLLLAVSGLKLPRVATDTLGMTGLALYAGLLGLAVQHARRRADA